MHIADDIRYIGVNDTTLDLFESQYLIPHGMSYNSYIILDEKIAIIDSVDMHFTAQWLDKLSGELKGKTPDYLIIQHMEPDHSGSLSAFMQTYPQTIVVATTQAFGMMRAFFGEEYPDRRRVIKEGDVLQLGRHALTFITAPMVHWPEVMITYDQLSRTLFSADAFGRFGTPEASVDWADEARRYYFGIVGKYGLQVQQLLRKVSMFDVQTICPLHGPVLNENLSYCLDLYDIWSSYQPESRGVTVAFSSVYGHTKETAEKFAQQLRDAGETVALHDLTRGDMSAAVADAFRYDRLVLATTTYNMGIFPCMHAFLHHLAERGYRSRTVGLIENGSWAPAAAKGMRAALAECKDLTFAETTVTIRSALNKASLAQMDALAKEMIG